MADLVIVDTDVLIDVARNINEAVSFLQQLEKQFDLAVSTITYMELLVGCRNKEELQQLERFIRRFTIMRLNERVSDVATDLLRQYRLSHGLLIADSLIAATAIAYDLEFTTKNQRDYRFIGALRLLSYR